MIKRWASIRVSNTLMTQLHLNHLNLDEAVCLFYQIAESMKKSKPNYNYRGKRQNAWIFRGFYPKTNIFFKITLVNNEMTGDQPLVSVYSLNEKKGAQTKFVFVGIEDILAYVENATTGQILNFKENLTLGIPKPKKPRTMAPKGIKRLELEKK